MRPKGQSDIIAVVLIVLIAIALLGVAYTFGLPLINKNQDQALSNRVDAFFSQTNSNSLPAKIQAVANGGSKDQVTLDVTGITRLAPGGTAGVNNNSIDFSFQSSVSTKGADQGWISLSGAQCSPGPVPGIIGQDQPSVVCARADKVSANLYNITYRVYFRELDDAQQRSGFLISLEQHPASSLISSGGSPNIRIEFDKRQEVVQGSKDLIITYVKILLV